MPMWLVPKAKSPVWEDDRLNPKRAEQEPGWAVPDALIWTTPCPPRFDQPDYRSGCLRRVCRCFILISIGWTASARVGRVTFVQAQWQLGQAHCRNKTCPAKRQPVYSSRSAPKPVATASRDPRGVQQQLLCNRVYGDSGKRNTRRPRIARMGMGAAMR